MLFMSSKKGLSKKTLVLALIVSMIWGFSFVATDILLDSFEPVQILLLRWSVAAVLYLALVLKGTIRFNFRKNHLRWILLTAIAEPCVYAIFETYGVKFTSPSVSSIFIATIPCMTLITGSVFFHGKVTKRGVLGIVLAFTGVLICTIFPAGMSAGGRPIGYLALIITVISGAVYAHFSAKAGQTYPAMSITAFMAFTAVPWFALLNHTMGYGLSTFSVLFTSPKLIAGVLFLGVFCSAVCYQGYNRILQTTSDPAMANNIVANLVTVFGVIAGILVRHDPFGWYTPVGLVITLIGVAVSSRESR